MGFSDGATYSLGIGRINGDLFRRVAALSPGYLLPAKTLGTPKVFITHGTQDQVLPIESASRRIVPSLRGAGYDVEYHEFAGGHTVTADLLSAAMAWVSTA
jgi:phospholipase/carboxylesterase